MTEFLPAESYKDRPNWLGTESPSTLLHVKAFDFYGENCTQEIADQQLSSAAQTVLNAVASKPSGKTCARTAAALRAASWQLTNAKAISTLLTIADELDPLIND